MRLHRWVGVGTGCTSTLTYAEVRWLPGGLRNGVATGLDVCHMEWSTVHFIIAVMKKDSEDVPDA